MQEEPRRRDLGLALLTQASVPRAIDRSHAAYTQRAEDLVFAEEDRAYGGVAAPGPAEAPDP